MFPGEGGFNRFRRGERRRFGLQCVQAIANLRLSHDPAYVQSSPKFPPPEADKPLRKRRISRRPVSSYWQHL